MPTAGRPCSPACRQTTSARPASCGATPITGGTSSRETGYAWWIERFRALLELVDRVRIDHFRGFEASWEVPGDASTAVRGEWVKGPNASLFEAVQSALKTDPTALRRREPRRHHAGRGSAARAVRISRDGDPSVCVRQRPAGARFQASQLPTKPRGLHRNARQRHHRRMVDRCGWAQHTVGREIENEREHARRYLGFDGGEVHWEFIRAALASVADTAIVPAQDLMGLGSEARMNRPGTVSGNWRWRLVPGQLTHETANARRHDRDLRPRLTPTRCRLQLDARKRSTRAEEAIGELAIW